MKKVLFALCLTAVSLAAFGQGKVAFGNDSNHYFVLGYALDADSGGGTTSTNGNTPSGTVGAIPQSPLPSGNSLEAALYAGQSSSSMTLQTVSVLTGANWLSAGLMATKLVTLTIPGGATAYFDIVVVDAGTILPTNFPTFFPFQIYFGDSGLFTATPGTSITFPALTAGGPASSTWAPANLVISTIPEPTSVCFVGLSAAGMFLRRRKQRRKPRTG